VALPRNHGPVKTLQQLSDVVQREKPKTLEAMTQKLWRLGIPHRIIQLPEFWLNHDNQIEAGLFLAADQHEPGEWWFVRITASGLRVQTIGEHNLPVPTLAELPSRVVSLWPCLPIAASHEWSDLIKYLDLKTATCRALPAAGIDALLWIALVSLVGLVLAGQLSNHITIGFAALALLVRVALNNQWNRYWINRSDYQKRAIGINAIMQLLRLPLSTLKSIGGSAAVSISASLQEQGQEIPQVLSHLLPAVSLFALTTIWLLTNQPSLGAFSLIGCLTWITTVLATTPSTVQLKSRKAQYEFTAIQRSKELIENNENIRLAGAEAQALSWWRESTSAVSRLQVRLDNREFLITLVILGAAAITLCAAVLLPDRNEKLIALIITSMQLASAQKITTQLTQLEQLKYNWKLASKAMRDKPRNYEPTKDPGCIVGNIALQDVSFGYQGSETLALNNISFEVNAGSFVAIVGPNAGGKSTLLRLLLGLETPQKGTIVIGNENMRNIDEELLRSQIGAVLQNPKLIGNTLKDAVIAGRDISLAEAWEAVELAGLGDELRALPMGLQTPISDGAKNFSIGQQKRLTIARALAGRPRLLVLDEATSSLDNRAQSHIFDSFQSLGITCFMVTHQLNTVQKADVILVINNGVLDQQGTFTELSQQAGLFRELMKQQML